MFLGGWASGALENLIETWGKNSEESSQKGGNPNKKRMPWNHQPASDFRRVHLLLKGFVSDDPGVLLIDLLKEIPDLSNMHLLHHMPLPPLQIHANMFLPHPYVWILLPWLCFSIYDWSTVLHMPESQETGESWYVELQMRAKCWRKPVYLEIVPLQKT